MGAGFCAAALGVVLLRRVLVRRDERVRLPLLVTDVFRPERETARERAVVGTAAAFCDAGRRVRCRYRERPDERRLRCCACFAEESACRTVCADPGLGTALAEDVAVAAAEAGTVAGEEVSGGREASSLWLAGAAAAGAATMALSVTAGASASGEAAGAGAGVISGEAAAADAAAGEVTRASSRSRRCCACTVW